MVCDQIMAEYDVIIIGGGVGGTGVGAILASKGLKILLIEKNFCQGTQAAQPYRAGYLIFKVSYR